MLLLDTQLLLWAAVEPDRLPAKGAQLIRARATPLAFSLASIWEVAIKSSLGRADFALDPRLLHDALLNEGFVAMPIRAEHLFRVATLPWVHRDPFDRLLVAQAMEDKFTLLTADAALAGYGRCVRVL
jgi:PIN domain nuclease of toxin-antitoxin system